METWSRGLRLGTTWTCDGLSRFSIKSTFVMLTNLQQQLPACSQDSAFYDSNLLTVRRSYIQPIPRGVTFSKALSKLGPGPTPGMVLRLSITDCARGCNNRGQSRPSISAIDVTGKTFFERLYLVSGLSTFGPCVKCPYAPTIPTVHCTTISQFLCNFF